MAFNPKLWASLVPRNPAEPKPNHYVEMARVAWQNRDQLYEAKQKGTRVAVVNTFFEPGLQRYWVPSVVESAIFGTRFADTWFAVDTGGDLAFLLGVFKVLAAEGWVDDEFIAARTTGCAEARAAAEAASFEELEAGSGATRSEMRRFAEMLRDAKRAVLAGALRGGVGLPAAGLPGPDRGRDGPGPEASWAGPTSAP